MERQRCSGDDGVSLVETVVAMLVFAIFSLVVAQTLLGSMGVAKSNTQRVAAANLAQQQAEVVRGLRTLDLPDGVTTLPPVTLEGTTYEITRDVRFVASTGGGSVCSGSSDALAYKLVALSVRWPQMGAVKPVRVDTLMTLGLGANEADGSRGTAAIAVRTAADQPNVDRVVTLQPGGIAGRTGSDGCVVFPNLTPGVPYTATLDEVPFVGRQGATQLSAALSVTASRITRLVFAYDRRAAVGLQLSAPAGFPVPSGLGASLDSSLLQPSSTRAFPDCAGTTTAPTNCVTQAGSTLTASSLYPATYAAWAGTCEDARPAEPVIATATAGTTTTAAVSLGALEVQLGPTTSGTVGARPMYAFHQPDGTCGAGEVWPLVGSGAGRRVALPAGRWTLVMDSTGEDTGSYGAPVDVVAGEVTAVVLP